MKPQNSSKFQKKKKNEKDWIGMGASCHKSYGGYEKIWKAILHITATYAEIMNAVWLLVWGGPKASYINAYYRKHAVIGMFWLLYLWTGNLSANSRKPWHQNHIVLLDCYWRAFDSASHPTLADKFTIRYKNINHALQRKGFCFVADKTNYTDSSEMNCL